MSDTPTTDTITACAPERINHEPGTPNGIEHGARGIAGRGVLVDFARWAKATGVKAEPNTAYPISTAQMQEAAKAQGVTFETGDILLFRTGWIEWYDSLTARQQLSWDTIRRGAASGWSKATRCCASCGTTTLRRWLPIAPRSKCRPPQLSAAFTKF